MTIHEMESRLHEEGIYRINGPATEIKQLKQSIMQGAITNETLKGIVDTNTICSTIKGHGVDLFVRVKKTKTLANKNIRVISCFLIP